MYCAGPVTTLLAVCRASQSTGSLLNYKEMKSSSTLQVTRFVLMPDTFPFIGTALCKWPEPLLNEYGGYFLGCRPPRDQKYCMEEIYNVQMYSQPAAKYCCWIATKLELKHKIPLDPQWTFLSCAQSLLCSLQAKLALELRNHHSMKYAFK